MKCLIRILVLGRNFPFALEDLEVGLFHSKIQSKCVKNKGHLAIKDQSPESDTDISNSFFRCFLENSFFKSESTCVVRETLNKQPSL